LQEYAPPKPPKSNHRYIFVLYRQAGTDIQVAAPGGRATFDAIAFATAQALTPVGVNYFCVHAAEFGK
jgi:phosphatidylethanolamine-binding protein (PEBP) family uncharacterized protein